MNKEEVIKEAYGEYWEIAKPFADENGWIDRFEQSFYLNIGNWGIQNPPIIKNILGHNDNGGIQVYNDRWRPKSLQGIEDNNGWIKIESEDDLPKESGLYFVYNKEKEVEIYNLSFDENCIKYWLRNATHYQPIQKPTLPIY